MGFLDSFGTLAASIIAAIVMLIFAILSFFVTVFVVDVGAGIAGLSPNADFIVLSAAVIAGSAIVAGSGPLAALGDREGWRIEGRAGRVHYSGADDRYSIEYYAPSDCVLYWKVPPDGAGEAAVPVGRSTVPRPLRERIREDLRVAGIDPEVEQRTL